MSEANPQPQQVLVYPQYQQNNEDEINLVDLWQALVKQKNTIFGTTAIVTLIAILYALFATPIYKAETVFLPPSEGDIQHLQINDANDANDVSYISNVNLDNVYNNFKRNLGSIALRKQLFDTMSLADQFAPNRDETSNIDEIFNEFNKNVKLTIPNPKKGEFSLPITTLSLERNAPELMAEVINRFSEQAEQATVAELTSNIDTKVKERIKETQLEIKLLLEKTKKQRLNEVKRLEIADSFRAW
ncbi:MAG: hypothetical protein GY829_11285 [Gammaproteobacteria bacterium]|nr:hypothetical protein [Gammaproteobacteria bacterium]